MSRKPLYFILLVFIIGMLLGTIFSLLISTMIPEGTIKDFFLLTKSIGWGATENNWLELGFMRIKVGLFVDISVLSLVGIFVSWYMLRYFK